MMRRGGRNTKAFLGVLDDKEAEVLSQDEKMARAAEKMQENFLKEQALYKAGDIQVSLKHQLVPLPEIKGDDYRNNGCRFI